MRKEHWEYLQDLKITHSITTSSGRFNISPQALSKIIITLENELGFKLLNRNHLGVTFTPEGEYALNSAIKFFKDLENIKAHIAPLHNSKMNIQNISTVISTGLEQNDINKITAQYHKLWPEANISFTPSPINKIIDMITKKELNYAITSIFFNNHVMLDNIADGLFQNNPIGFYPFDYSDIVALIPKSHTLANAKYISLKTAFKHDILVYSPTNNMDFSNLAFLPGLNLPYPKNCKIECDWKVFIGQLVGNNYISIGNNIVKDYSSTFLERVNLVPLKEKIQLVICYLYHKDNSIFDFDVPAIHLNSL